MSLAISTSAASSPSSRSSTSPAHPATPLTPPNASVSFSLPSQQADQFAFDNLNLDTSSATPLANNTGAAAGGAVRRKPSRRANTAERRATHNAVERQRRETLNGRFLDLAALLPNLASVRRPSKSAIVNSSIALIHTQRRARATAARELRMLKLEADQIRAELNDWRESAGMGHARIEEPARSRDFEELSSGILEESEAGLLEEERRALEIVKEGLRMDANGMGGSDVVGNPFAYDMPCNGGMSAYGGAGEDDEEDTSSDSHSGRVRPGSQGSSVNGSMPSLPVSIPQPRNNGHVAPQPLIFDSNSALLQSHPTHSAGINSFSYDMHALNGLGPLSPTSLHPHPQDKLTAWNSQIYGIQPQQNQYQVLNMFTPPASAHSIGGFMGYDDSDNTSSSVGSDNTHHHGHTVAAHHLHAHITAHQPRSASSVRALGSKTASSPPSSAPLAATTYVDATVNGAGNAFAAAYGAYTKVGGGGNAYGAAPGLFM